VQKPVSPQRAAEESYGLAPEEYERPIRVGDGGDSLGVQPQRQPFVVAPEVRRLHPRVARPEDTEHARHDGGGRGGREGARAPGARGRGRAQSRPPSEEGLTTARIEDPKGSEKWRSTSRSRARTRCRTSLMGGKTRSSTLRRSWAR